MKDRIIKFLNSEGVSATKFADEIGVQRSSVSHILSGRNNPSFEFIQKILNRYRNLNAEWLIQGSGSMYKKAESSLPPINIESKVINTPENQLNLFAEKADKPIAIPEEKKSFPSMVDLKPDASRKVEKIMVFYSDRTFDEFFPS
jgi:transcriptional regulator with XRE-family HTH domain